MSKNGFYKFTGSDDKEYRISLKQKRFCELFLEFKGNGTDAAYEVYDCRNNNVAAALASRELRKVNIIAYINTKLIEYGFTDTNVKKQHLFLLNQFGDLTSKKNAIDMFYKLKGDYASEKIDLTSKGEKIEGFNFVRPKE